MTTFRKVREGLDFSGGFFRRMVDPLIVDSTPTKKRDLDAGLDLIAAASAVIPVGQRGLIPVGIEVEILPGYVGLVKARSGLAVNHGIIVGAGVIDSPYRGPVKVLLFNFGDKDFMVNIGDRIAQLVTVPCNLGLYEEVEYLSSTDRGADGFGSSGR